jgi:FSR family fosmidomycin resistance protein-like MFS transporter
MARVMVISAVHAVHDTYTGFLPPLLPLFISALALSRTEAGLLTVFLQGPSLLQPLIGHLADRANLRRVVPLAPAVTAAMMSLLGVAPSYFALAPSYFALAIMLFVVGLSSAMFHAVAPVIAGTLSGRSLGRGMGFWMVGGELGRVLGPVVVVSVLAMMSVRELPWLMIVGLLGSALLYARMDALVPASAGRARPSDMSWQQALRSIGPLWVPLLTLIVVRAMFTASLGIYLPTLLTEEGLSLWVAGMALAAYEAAGVVGALVGGSVSDRLGRRTVILTTLLMTSLLLILFLLVRTWVRVPILLALGFVSLSLNPVGMALVQESLPNNRALANGIYTGTGFALRATAVVLLGVIGDAHSLHLAFFVSAIIPLLGMPLVLRLPKGARQAHV